MLGKKQAMWKYLVTVYIRRHFKSYNIYKSSFQEAEILNTNSNFQYKMKEMVENLVLELVEENLYAKGISLYIRYSKDCIPATGGAMKLTQATCSIKRYRKLSVSYS